MYTILIKKGNVERVLFFDNEKSEYTWGKIEDTATYDMELKLFASVEAARDFYKTYRFWLVRDYISGSIYIAKFKPVEWIGEI